MSDAILWVDGTGRRRWQPVLSDGRKQWEYADNWSHSVHWFRDNPHNTNDARLYRLRASAVRAARRQERHEARSSWKTAGEDD